MAEASALMKVVQLLLQNLATSEAMAQPELHRSFLEFAVRHKDAALAFMADAGPRLDARVYGALSVN
ncbi:hypothetical protein [Rhizobium rhizosphaerae]|uniref:hypothetical protein n=1 Tax=Xaviernesmea rhizosphaerae TaxID=1672749 RepID=UPI001300E017|nr:hypothetical protein [Xaviernesmea rhizosphaerae]